MVKYLALCVFVVAGSSFCAQAQFKVSSSHVEIAERGPVESLLIENGTNRFTVIPPADWRVSVAKGERTLSLTGPDLTTTIVLKFAPPLARLDDVTTLEALEKKTATRFQSGQIVGKFRASTGLVPGDGFEVAWHRDTGNQFRTRLAFVPFDGGTAEFFLQGTAAGVETNLFSYAMLLNSFSRAEANTR